MANPLAVFALVTVVVAATATAGLWFVPFVAGGPLACCRCGGRRSTPPSPSPSPSPRSSRPSSRWPAPGSPAPSSRADGQRLAAISQPSRIRSGALHPGQPWTADRHCSGTADAP